MVDVWDEVLKVFGSEDKAEYWYYNKTLKEFGGLSPHEVVTQGGSQEVLEILSRLDHGYW